MLSLQQTIEYQAGAARAKVDLTRRPARYLVLGMLAGAYVGIGVLLMVSAAGPLQAAGSGWVKLTQGAVFGVALTLVVFAGGELATSNMMTLPQGVARRSIRLREAGWTLGLCLVANLAGAVLFAWLVHVSGVLHSNAAAGAMVDSMLQAKAAEPAGQLFVRGILCNVLVCLAIWMCARTSSATAKLVLIFWCIFAFITSGFEHVVANMTTLTWGVLGGGVGIGEFARNICWVGLGNLVGGCVFVGLAYVVAAGPHPPVPAAVPDAAPQVPAAVPDAAPQVPAAEVAAEPDAEVIAEPDAEPAPEPAAAGRR